MRILLKGRADGMADTRVEADGVEVEFDSGTVVEVKFDSSLDEYLILIEPSDGGVRECVHSELMSS